MSRFGDKFASDGIPRLLDHLGDTATFTWPPDGAGLEREWIFEEYPHDGGPSETRRGRGIVASDPTIGIEKPRRGMQVTFEGDVWMVTHVESDAAGNFVLEVEAHAEPRGRTGG